MARGSEVTNRNVQPSKATRLGSGYSHMRYGRGRLGWWRRSQVYTLRFQLLELEGELEAEAALAWAAQELPADE